MSNAPDSYNDTHSTQADSYNYSRETIREAARLLNLAKRLR